MDLDNVERLLEIVRSTIKEAEHGFLITRSESGESNARLMHPYEPEEDLTIWLGASPASRKVREIQKFDKVTLAFVNPRETAYVTILGTATIVDDLQMKRKYWRSYWSDMFPGGPETDQYVLIKILPYRIELMNFAREVLPQPYGLKPAGLVQRNGTWSLIESRDEL